MIPEHISPQIQIVSTMEIDQSEWPLPAYIKAWKAFRSVSNEADEIASHLARQKWVPKSIPINILDVGTGDGVLLQKILLLCSHSVRDVVVADPNPAFLTEARSHLADVHISGQLKVINKKIEEVDRDVIRSADLAIFSHVVYLTGAAPLLSTLRELRSGSCCYIVFDAEASIFSHLWTRTAAPEYLLRVREARGKIESLSEEKWVINKTTILTQVKNPRHLRPEIGDLIKSLLCYIDVADMDIETLNWVNGELENAGRFGNIQCSSDCYQLIRK
jgi:SAM-dependent methyltransferase